MTNSSFDEVGQEAIDAVLAASRALVAVAARSLSSSEEDVTIAQFRAVVIVATHPACSLNALAAALDVTAPTASRMCDRLSAKRIINRTSDPNDRRQIRVELTERGQALFDTVMQRRREEVSKILKAVPSEDQAVIVSSLRRFAAAAGESMTTPWTAGWEL